MVKNRISWVVVQIHDGLTENARNAVAKGVGAARRKDESSVLFREQVTPIPEFDD